MGKWQFAVPGVFLQIQTCDGAPFFGFAERCRQSECNYTTLYYLKYAIVNTAHLADTLLQIVYAK
jgi:hypothetical protein